MLTIILQKVSLEFHESSSFYRSVNIRDKNNGNLLGNYLRNHRVDPRVLLLSYLDFRFLESSRGAWAKAHAHIRQCQGCNVVKDVDVPLPEETSPEVQR